MIEAMRIKVDHQVPPDRRLYSWPLVRSCIGARFVAETLDRLPKLERSTCGTHKDDYRASKIWLLRKGHLSRAQHKWLPKLYLCIGSRDFWTVAERVLFDEVLLDHVISLKVLRLWNLDPEGRKKDLEGGAFIRPDKIVLYANDPDSLRCAASRLATLKRGAATHTMWHVRTMVSLGYLQGADSRGIYAGMDPTFIGTSWRVYNAICKCWLRMNRAYVKQEYGSVAAWLALMNLSQGHNGPCSLAPSEEVTRFIELNWPRMTC